MNMHIYCDNSTIFITIIYSFSPSPHNYSTNAKNKFSDWLSGESSNSGLNITSKYSPPVMESKCLKHKVIVLCVMANLSEHMDAMNKKHLHVYAKKEMSNVLLQNYYL